MWTKFPTKQLRTRISRNSQSNSLLRYNQPSMLGNYGTFLNALFSLTSQWCLTWDMSKPKIFLKLKFVFLTTILGHSCLHILSSCSAYFILSKQQSLQNRHIENIRQQENKAYSQCSTRDYTLTISWYTWNADELSLFWLDDWELDLLPRLWLVGGCLLPDPWLVSCLLPCESWRGLDWSMDWLLWVMV